MGKKRVITKSGDTRGQSRGQTTRGLKAGKKLSFGIVTIQATYNNTMITIADGEGNVVAWSTAGSLGFSGAKKSTPFAASRVAEHVVQKIEKTGLKDIRIFAKGVGSGRDSAIRALANHGLNIVSIKDITPLPHNGPRAKKARRV